MRVTQPTHLVHHAGKCSLCPSQLVRSVRHKRLQFGVFAPELLSPFRLLRLFVFDLRDLVTQFFHLFPCILRLRLCVIDAAIHLRERLLCAHKLLLEGRERICLPLAELLHACDLGFEVAITLSLRTKLIETATLRVEGVQPGTGLVEVAPLGVFFAADALPLREEGGELLLFGCDSVFDSRELLLQRVPTASGALGSQLQVGNSTFEFGAGADKVCELGLGALAGEVEGGYVRPELSDRAFKVLRRNETHAFNVCLSGKQG